MKPFLLFCVLCLLSFPSVSTFESLLMGEDIQLLVSDNIPSNHILGSMLSDWRAPFPLSDGFGEGEIREHLSTTNSNWVIERADAPKKIWRMGDRSLVLDIEGYPHIAYGGDFLYYAWQDSTGWHHETVDETPITGSFTSLALDSEGHPHISYCQLLVWESRICQTLKYASYNGVSWHVEVVDSGARVGGYTSLALDSADQPHISYLDETNDDLKYTHYNGTTWQIETVDSEGIVGYYTSIALDTMDQPHISFHDYTNVQLKYAYHNPSGWQIETIRSEGYAISGSASSLALDSNNFPHISCTSGNLVYAYKDTTGWHTETVDSENYTWMRNSLALDNHSYPHISYIGNHGLGYAHYDGSAWQIHSIDAATSDTSLALDILGYPHISYYSEQSGHKIKYTYYDGTTWRIEAVDNVGIVGSYTSLALDAQDQPHISYHDETRGDLKYAWHDDSSWQIETVDEESTGQYTSLALDSLDQPHISYFASWPNHDLKYASFDGVNWQVETVDSEGIVGQHASLALDVNDHPHISYFDYSNWHLKYAYYDGTSWQIETLDRETYGGKYTSLALDTLGWPHISYMGGTGLKYAYYDGASWQIETVDGEGYVGGCTSLALDSSGHPHISYYSWTGFALKYAHFDGTEWQINTVDSEGYVGWHSSLALDSYGRPHISYRLCGYEVCGFLKYAYYDGSRWHTEIVDSSGGYTSLDLDTVGTPHISYYDEANGDLKYAHQLCIPVDEVNVSGPMCIPAGINGLYSAIYTPVTSTNPFISWDNGTIGHNSSYSWTITGVHSLSVTTTNGCGGAKGILSVTVFCQAVKGVNIEGPTTLFVRQEGFYRVTPVPITASLPLTFAWDNGDIGSSAVYSWTNIGVHTLSITVSNACGEDQEDLTVHVEPWPHHLFLPLAWLTPP